MSIYDKKTKIFIDEVPFTLFKNFLNKFVEILKCYLVQKDIC